MRKTEFNIIKKIVGHTMIGLPYAYKWKILSYSPFLCEWYVQVHLYAVQYEIWIILFDLILFCSVFTWFCIFMYVRCIYVNCISAAKRKFMCCVSSDNNNHAQAYAQRVSYQLFNNFKHNLKRKTSVLYSKT